MRTDEVWKNVFRLTRTRQHLGGFRIRIELVEYVQRRAEEIEVRPGWKAAQAVDQHRAPRRARGFRCAPFLYDVLVAAVFRHPVEEAVYDHHKNCLRSEYVVQGSWK